MTDAERKFDMLRRQYLAAAEREERYRTDVLLKKYGRMNPPSYWLNKTEENKLATLDRAQWRAHDKMFDLLDEVATRNFRSGVPAHWVMEQLTFADATTLGAMSVVPPVAYGYSRRDAEAFAAAPPPVAGSVVV